MYLLLSISRKDTPFPLIVKRRRRRRKRRSTGGGAQEEKCRLGYNSLISTVDFRFRPRSGHKRWQTAKEPANRYVQFRTSVVVVEHS
jgi:hypothetical protein